MAKATQRTQIAKLKKTGKTGAKNRSSAVKSKADLTCVDKYYEVEKAFASTPVHPALELFFGYCLHKAAQRLRVSVNEKLAKFSINAPQFGLLHILAKSGPLSQVQIGTEMGIDKASMVKLIDGLEKLGWVARTVGKSDRRVNLVEATTQGKKALDKLFEVRNECEKEFLKHLTNEEQEFLRRIVPTLLR